ncbi:hypothetical protein [Gordonia liuliyuniae]|uniref:Minor tail protein n=1 Tax=Gordonia liuliyuniae TaxID=2911517 RepID=A0ABS9IYI0_9ACTN|nr:hypothetical protein [Gordonia liuliyuniae]MCF8590576.1 hypothetical protein [Gordonia liuliyuniae]
MFAGQLIAENRRGGAIAEFSIGGGSVVTEAAKILVTVLTMALMFVPRATATAAAPDPDLVVSSKLEAPVVSSGGEAKGARYFVSAILDVPVAIVYPPTVAETPALSAWHRISVTGPAVSNVSAVVPTLRASHVMPVPTVSGSGDARTPAVAVGASFNRQRVSKNSNFTIGASGWNLLTGWSSDSTYPATIVGEKLVVQGSGAATITWSVTQSGSGTQSARAYYNGVAVGAEFGTGTGGGTRTTTREVSAGDEIYVMVTGVFTSVAAAGTYIDVVPV